MTDADRPSGMEPPFIIGLMHGDGWQRCCICFEVHEAPYDGLYRDADGQLWDVCAGNCAKEAGYA